MSRDQTFEGSATLESVDDLIAYFRDGEKSIDEGLLKIGTETEKIPFDMKTLQPLDFDSGIVKIFTALQNQGWQPPHASPPITALFQDGASITLEPGGQVELSGAPLVSIHETKVELSQHLQQLHAIGQEHQLDFSFLAHRPLPPLEDIHWMPRRRYQLMRQYLQHRGRHAWTMMLATAAIQANYDYTSEADMVAKVRCATRLSAVVMAMFANSPYRQGQWSGWRSLRGSSWWHVDADRCGLHPWVFDEDFGYARHVQYVLNVPMFFVWHEGQLQEAAGMTFGEFLQRGFGGRQPTLADWELHLSTLFPDVRVKQFIEVRSADACPPALTLALPALWKGLFYDADALSAANALFAKFDFATLLQMQRSAAQDALQGHGVGWHLGELAAEVVKLSKQGLSRQAQCNVHGDDETIYLKPLEHIVSTRQTLADQMLARFGERIDADDVRREVMQYNSLSACAAEI